MKERTREECGRCLGPGEDKDGGVELDFLGGHAYAFLGRVVAEDVGHCPSL